MTTFAERIEALGNEEFLDSVIIAHGFTPYGRDYDVTLYTVASLPADVPIGDTTGTYIDARYRYRFTHVPEAHLRSSVQPEWWRKSWDDLFTDREAWEAAGEPEGFVWGDERADAYPGLFYVENSGRAAEWSQAIGHKMHEVRIETNVFVLHLVCNDLKIHRLAVGDPRTLTMRDLEQPESVQPSVGRVWSGTVAALAEAFGCPSCLTFAGQEATAGRPRRGSGAPAGDATARRSGLRRD